jgi:hypothetical protein
MPARTATDHKLSKCPSYGPTGMAFEHIGCLRVVFGARWCVRALSLKQMFQDAIDLPMVGSVKSIRIPDDRPATRTV